MSVGEELDEIGKCQYLDFESDADGASVRIECPCPGVKTKDRIILCRPHRELTERKALAVRRGAS